MMGLLRRLLPYTTLVLILTAAYTGWTLYSRYRAGQAAEQSLRESQAKDAQKVVDRFGGGRLKILSFYTTPVKASPGEKVLVCYSVANATEVSIEPQIEPIKPSISRCVEAHPKQTTVYTLTARDQSGASTTQTAAVQIR